MLTLELGRYTTVYAEFTKHAQLLEIDKQSESEDEVKPKQLAESI